MPCTRAAQAYEEHLLQQIATQSSNEHENYETPEQVARRQVDETWERFGRPTAVPDVNQIVESDEDNCEFPASCISDGRLIGEQIMQQLNQHR